MEICLPGIIHIAVSSNFELKALFMYALKYLTILCLILCSSFIHMQGLVIMDRYKLVVLNLNTCILTERADSA